ncbi:DUF1217 domain-containing protein [Aquibium sp. LZ166]|uniref:DUF1217 domain-containing protein n=1 Tax=Aquibium pacificus TaxID=3153579 RepID=A0ABV3SCX1_9HYPH
MVSTYTSYLTITRDIDLSLERVESQPFVQRETEYYLENIENVKSIDEFVGDRRLFNYAMKAFGLEDMAYAKAFMVKLLEEGVEDSESFANTLSDQRYKDFAETFDFARYGETATVFDRTRQGTVDKYLRQTLEQDAGETNEGVRLALYFERKAPDLTSMYGVLADTALAKVVRTSFGLPDSFALLDIDKQVEILEKKLDIEDLEDPEVLSKFLTRFTSLWEIENPTTSSVSNLSVLFGQPTEFGISTDVLLTIQQLKF